MESLLKGMSDKMIFAINAYASLVISRLKIHIFQCGHTKPSFALTAQSTHPENMNLNIDDLSAISGWILKHYIPFWSWFYFLSNVSRVRRFAFFKSCLLFCIKLKFTLISQIALFLEFRALFPVKKKGSKQKIASCLPTKYTNCN